MPLETGTRLGLYEILEPIGAGGMGEVYRARDTKLGRDVAIKVLPADLGGDPDRLARFEREARLLASVNHPSIAVLHGLEEWDTRHFLVMELVPGETLAERIARGPVPIGEALELFRQIADGLSAAHDKGIVHRDLKPANIKITPDGAIKILDFGLAKALHGELGSDGGDPSQSATLTKGTALGAIMGTASYMSPEQARGKSVDKQSDLWAFGCVLYEALTARRPFEGETVTDVFAAILDKEPDWTALPAEVPWRVQETTRRCLRKDRRTRLRDAGDVRIELEEAYTAPGEVARTTKTGARSAQVALAMVAASALTALGVWILFGPDAPPPSPVTRSVIPLEAGEDLPSAKDLNFGNPAIAISPNGRYVAYVVLVDRSRTLYLRALDETEPRRIDRGDDVEMPLFSADSGWLAYYGDARLKKAAVSGGAPVTITEMSEAPRGASWGLDGDIVYPLGLGVGLSRVSAEGGAPELLTVPDRGRREKSHRHPEVLPGGKGVLFIVGSGDLVTWDDASIAVLSLETGEHRVLLEGGSYARYSPTGHILYARDGQILAVPFDLEALELRGAPVPVMDGVYSALASGSADFGISRAGTLLYASGSSDDELMRMVWVDREGRTEPLLEAPRPYTSAEPSPDGRSLAVWVEEANGSIWTHDLARGTSTRLITGYDNHIPVWHPDGRRLAFRSNRDGPFNLYWQAVDGSGGAERLATSAHDQSPSSWTPDGRRLVFDEIRAETGSDLWILSVEGDRTPQALLQTPSDERQASVSPDGRFIAYASNESGRFEIYVRPFPELDEKIQVSTDGGSYPKWNPQGGELFYLQGDALMAVAVEMQGGLELGGPRPLAHGMIPYYGVDPSGRRFTTLDPVENTPSPRRIHLVQNWFQELELLAPAEN